MVTLSAEHARALLLHAAGFDREWPSGEAGIHAVLDALDWIQLDPIDRVGQNADLVVGARVDDVQRGDLHRIVQGRSFEHFAKERCIIHPRHFAQYRHHLVETPWWRTLEREGKVPPELLASVLAEVRERGPMPAEALTRRGEVKAMEWSGWRGTARLEVLALELLWTRCAVVASGRDARGRRLHDVPERALPVEAAAPPPTEAFADTMVVARVRSSGLLCRTTGPQWSMLAKARTDGTVGRLLAAGRIAEVRVGKRPYLVLPERLELNPADILERVRGRSAVLGPLDPLIWDRALVKEVFDFDYIWEIYKPASKRKWGYYVCPVLVDGTLGCRIEGRREGGVLVIDKRWGNAEPRAFERAAARLAALNRCPSVDTSSCDLR